MRFLVCFVLLALLGAGPAPTGGAIGSQAPALAATLLDGTRLAGEATHGKITVLNFWATWCPPCRVETPALVTAYGELKARDVAFLGIDTTETAPIVQTFLSAKGVPYPTALAGPDLYNAYSIAYIPTTIVIDAQGIVRARWMGGITPAQLAAYVADARAGRSAGVSVAQAQVDALLSPQRYYLGSTASEQRAAVQSMRDALARADTISQASQIDGERTQHEQGEMLVALATIESDLATSGAAKLSALIDMAQGYGDEDRWADAVQTYREALALDPYAANLSWSLSRAYYRLHDYKAMIVQARSYVQISPNFGEGWSNLALAYQRARRFPEAAKAYEKALPMMEAVEARSHSQNSIAAVADTALDAANVYVSLGDAANTKRMFALANTFGDKLAPTGNFTTLKRNVKERTQEGLVAVTLSSGPRKPVLSIAPWSGTDLPGSVATTLKYRLIVAAPAGSRVTLQVRGLRSQWVASFCTDGLCSPQHVAFTAPPSGVKTYEFQLVPPHDGAEPGGVSVLVNGGASVAVPTAQ